MLGQPVLDNSKLLMYNHIKAKYGDKASLLYTDTDSLLFEVETDDVYADMKANATQYDFSDYPRRHRNHSIENKKVVEVCMGMGKTGIPGSHGIPMGFPWEWE